MSYQIMTVNTEAKEFILYIQKKYNLDSQGKAILHLQKLYEETYDKTTGKKK